MAKRKGQVVGAQLVTPDTLLTFPILDMNDTIGGRHFVATIAERNAIPASHRRVGMLVYVAEDQKDYQLKAGTPTTGTTSNANWKEYAPGVPEDIITSHQTAEEIKFGTATPEGYTTLMQKISAIDTALAGKLSQHQTVEQIMFGDPATAGYNTLQQKLAALENAITAAGADQHIEDISWETKPSDTHNHAVKLNDELENLWAYANDPTKIMVTNADTTQSTLQAKITALESFMPTVEQISNNSGTALTTLLTDASDITKIKYNLSTTLKQKLDSMDSAIGNMSTNVEDITWATAPSNPTGINSNLSTNIVDIFTKLADQNLPGKIIVGANNETLTARLEYIENALTSAGVTPTIEQIRYSTTPTGHQETLAAELSHLYTSLADMNDPTKIQIPANTVATTASNLVAALSTLKGLIDSNAANIGVNSGNISTNTTNIASNLTAINKNKDDIAALTTRVAALESAPAAVPDIEDISWGETPSGHQATLSGEINSFANGTGIKVQTSQSSTKNLNDAITELYAKDATFADASGITVNDGTSNVNLNTAIQNLKSAVEGIDIPVIPQILLFNTSSPEVGSFTAQEFMTTQACKVNEIAVYTNSGATIAADIQVALESCGVSDSSYTTVTGTTVTLATSASGQMNRVDLSNASTPITFADNTRIRVNIIAYDSGNTVDVLNIRVTLVPYTAS